MRIARGIFTGLFVIVCLLAQQRVQALDAPPVDTTRDQAAQLLDTLENPEKRQRFTATLKAYIATLPPAGAALRDAPNTPPTSVAATKSVHEPSASKEVSTWMNDAGIRLAQNLRTVTEVPALSAWLNSEFGAPGDRDAFYQASLRILAILAITMGADMPLRWLFRRRTASSPDLHTTTDGAPRIRSTLQRLSERFVVFVGSALAGNAAVMLVPNLPVARTVAFGIVNTYVLVPFVLALIEEFVRAEAPTPARSEPVRQPLSTGLRFLLIAFLIVLAMQLLSDDILVDIGAPESVQDAVAKFIALLAHLLGVVIVLVCHSAISLWIRRRSRPGSRWAAITDSFASIWLTVAICAIAGSWLVWALGVRDAYRELLRVIFATLAVLLVSRFVSNLLLRTLDRRMTGFSSAAAGTFGSRLFGYRGLVRVILNFLLIVATLLALTEVWGLPSLTWLSEGHAGHRFAGFALQLLVLAIAGIVCWEAADLEFERKVNSLVDASSLSRATRLRTLQPIVRFALLVLIALLVLMTALNAVGINVGPLLAGASIVGVALGFGSQKLVQDFITGIFLLIEDAMDVGDWVTLAGVSGTVEHISIRSIRLRAGDGSVHLVPFSSVTSVNNTNRGVGNAAVTANIDPSEDTDRVAGILSDIALQMRQETAYASGMQSDLQLWGVDKVDGSMVTIAGQIVCTDGARWGVQREFNRRMKQRFEQEGVKLAVPKQTLRIARDPDTGVDP